MRPAAFFLVLSAMPATALDLPAPARLSAEAGSEADTLRLATGPWSEAGLPAKTLEGAVRHEAWRLPDTSLTTLQMLAPLREQIEAEGFAALFDCADAQCGGFDFRYALDLLPEPAMHVDLGDFRYFAASRDDGAGIAVLVSRGAGSGYIHLSRVGPGMAEIRGEASEDPVAPEHGPGNSAAPEGTLAETMARVGHVVLDDLEFATGSAELAEARFPSLVELAAWLREDPSRRIVLVGHSDAVGGLGPNIDLSRRRAAAVASRLVDRHGAAQAQIDSEGIGYLSPRTSNEAEEGRAANRRVEAVALSQ